MEKEAYALAEHNDQQTQQISALSPCAVRWSRRGRAPQIVPRFLKNGTTPPRPIQKCTTPHPARPH